MTLPANNSAQAIYDAMWADACAAYDADGVQPDPHLLARAADTRRGMTVLIRPDAAARSALMRVLDELRVFAPQQHAYHPDELHVTGLAIINCTPNFDLDDVPLDRYRAVLASVIQQAAPLTITYTGLTASPQAIIASGDADGDALNTLRNQLRAALHAAGLGASLDRRYTITTAHSTILRFQSPPRDLAGLRDYITAHRQQTIASFTAHSMEFVFNNWYMSRDVVRVLARYELQGKPDNA